jgi:hypothetical protein
MFPASSTATTGGHGVAAVSGIQICRAEVVNVDALLNKKDGRWEFLHHLSICAGVVKFYFARLGRHGKQPRA